MHLKQGAQLSSFSDPARYAASSFFPEVIHTSSLEIFSSQMKFFRLLAPTRSTSSFAGSAHIILNTCRAERRMPCSNHPSAMQALRNSTNYGSISDKRSAKKQCASGEMFCYASAVQPINLWCCPHLHPEYSTNKNPFRSKAGLEPPSPILNTESILIFTELFCWLPSGTSINGSSVNIYDYLHFGQRSTAYFGYERFFLVKVLQQY